MRLLHRSPGVAELIFGVGLVGACVADGVRLLPGVTMLGDRTIPTRWDALEPSLEEGLAAVRELRCERLRVFWCAGRAGFGSDAAQCEAERKSFELVLAWAERLEGQVELHLTSSAGGLHEGQLLVSAADQVTTVRPYAALKLAQEQALGRSSISARFIYRLSSVYGVPVPQRRLGLISTLVLNTLRHRPTVITADASTLRDFVSAEDVGRFIASEQKDEGLHYLVTGQPLSVWALQLAVERTLHRPVPVIYSLRKDNVASTSFLPSLRPPRWEAGSVESNLPRIVQGAQGWAPTSTAAP